jgi:uncharacterized protein (TIGR00730 family)
MGDPELDRRITELVELAGEGDNTDLISELVATALKLYRDQPDRGELKLFNTALKEMRYSALVFGAYRDRPKVTMFGSARTKPNDPEYQLAHDFAKHMTAERNWMVITGAGPGIMEAGNKGAGLDGSFGVNIRLPFEAAANEFIPESRLINFKYFFTRKLGFVKESNAFTIFPGGFGTMDETFELLTLIQTGKAPIHPIVLMEAGNSYWPRWQTFVKDELLAKGWIGEQDLHLYSVTNDVEEAAEEICGFYANYHSQRYINGKLVLRVRQTPTATQLETLNAEFSDIVVDGQIESTEITDRERVDDDATDCARIRMHFNRRAYGRLRRLIDTLNGFVTEAPTPHGPIADRYLDQFMGDPD